MLLEPYLCILCIFHQFLHLKIRILNFFNMLKASFGFHSHSHFGDCKFSCHVGFHLKEESNNTELACTFEHLLVYLHDASMLLPEQKWEQSGLLSVSSSNEELLLPSDSCPSCPLFTYAALGDGVGRFGAPPRSIYYPLIWNTCPEQTIKNLFAEDWMDRFHLVSDQKSGNSGTWGVGGGSEALSLCSWQAINSSQDMAWNKIK